MARDGTGTYNLPGSDFVALTSITAASVNAKFTDVGNALSQSISKDGQTVPTANQPMAGFRHTTVGNAAARDNYASAAQVQDGAVTWGGTTGGTATAYTATLGPALPAYVAGMRVVVRMHVTNGAAPTLNINSIGARNIRKATGTTPLVAGELLAGSIVELFDDGTQFVILAISNYGLGWQMLDQQVLTGAVAAYFSPVLPTALSAFRLEWQDARGNAEQAPFARFSTDGGGTYRQGASDYTVQGFAFVATAAAAVLNATQSFITLGQNVSASAACSGSIEFSRTSGIFRVESHGNFSGGLWRAGYGGGAAFSNATNVQMGFASTTINTGTFTLFGRV